MAKLLDGSQANIKSQNVKVLGETFPTTQTLIDGGTISLSADIQRQSIYIQSATDIILSAVSPIQTSGISDRQIVDIVNIGTFEISFSGVVIVPNGSASLGFYNSSWLKISQSAKDSESIVFQFSEHFIGTLSTTLGNFLVTFVGTGAGQSIVSSLNDNLGILSISTGTTATGKGLILTALSVILFGFGTWQFRAKIAILALSDINDTFTFRSGFQDSTTGDSTDGVYFRYTNGVNSGNWQCVCRASNVETVLNTAIPVTAFISTFTKLEIRVNATATNADFYIDKSYVGSITTNIPTGVGRNLGVIPVSIAKSLGIVSRSIYINYVSVLCTFTTPIW